MDSAAIAELWSDAKFPIVYLLRPQKVQILIPGDLVLYI